MAKKSFLVTPTDFPGPKGDYKGGPGVYGGEPGYPQRTGSKNGVPEKVYDKKPNTGKKELVYESPVTGSQK